ncbi:MAG: conjugal transfer protein MobA [Bacteroidota bacterium]|nr:conjugal transfer protein MobA [Bacteroidota bacterium]MDP4268532.1 conjugal transfer protein MobA [Bacteroidota bacterium]
MTTPKRKRTSGRKPKENPCSHRYSFNLNDADNARFLALFEQSGLKEKAHFITSCVFDRQLKVVKIDKAAMDYYMRLTTFHSQFRSVGVNYNQVTKAIKSAFTDKKALAFLYKLEKSTMELVTISKQVMELTEEFERRWLQK